MEAGGLRQVDEPLDDFGGEALSAIWRFVVSDKAGVLDCVILAYKYSQHKRTRKPRIFELKG